MKIIEMPISELVPYANNPRNNDNAVDAVAASIREFGFKVPIIVDKDNVIVAGHTRLKAAEKLGLSSVPVIRADNLTEEQVKAFRLADNKTGGEKRETTNTTSFLINSRQRKRRTTATLRKMFIRPLLTGWRLNTAFLPAISSGRFIRAVITKISFIKNLPLLWIIHLFQF